MANKHLERRSASLATRRRKLKPPFDVTKHLLEWLKLEIGKGAIFDELPPSFYSMATNITMYEQLSKLLNPQQWLNFIEALHLIMGKDKYYEQVKKDRCFHTSLLRNVRSFEECEEELIKAQKIMTSNLDTNK